MKLQNCYCYIPLFFAALCIAFGYNIHFTSAQESTMNNDTLGSILRLTDGESQKLYFHSPLISISGEETAHIIYSSNFSGPSFYVKSVDKGKTFTDPVQLTGNESSFVDVDVQNDSVYVMWNGEEDTLRFRLSNDNGVSFSPAINISSNAGWDADMVSDGKNIYVIWTEGDNVLFSRSIDGGLKFSYPKDIGESIGFAFPQLAVVKHKIYAMWVSYNDINSSRSELRTYLTKSNDQGITFFNQPLDLGRISDSYYSRPHMYANNENVHVIGVDNQTNNDYNVFIRRSVDGGNSFENPITIYNSTETGIDRIYYPFITGVNNSVYSVWYDPKSNGGGTFFTRSTNNGVSFENPLKISYAGSLPSSNPIISASGNFVYILFENEEQLYLAKSPDNGAHFENPMSLSSDSDNMFLEDATMTLSKSGNIAYIVWRGEDIPKPSDIFFRYVQYSNNTSNTLN